MPSSKPPEVGLALVGILLGACGYGAVRLDDSISVRLTVEGGSAEPEVAFVVESALREALRARGVRWARGEPDLDLRVRLTGVRVTLSPFAEPRLRAPRYDVAVGLRADWGSEAPLQVEGTASLLSRPGELPALEGAYRQYLGDAARNAAEELAVAWILRVRDSGPRFTPSPR